MWLWPLIFEPWDGLILRSNPMFMPSFTSDLKLFIPKSNLDCQHLQIKCLGIKGEVVNSKFPVLKGLQMSSWSLQDESSPETDERMKRWLKIRRFLKSNPFLELDWCSNIWVNVNCHQPPDKNTILIQTVLCGSGGGVDHGVPWRCH